MTEDPVQVVAIIGFTIARLRDNQKIWDQVKRLIRDRTDERTMRLNNRMEESIRLEIDAVNILLRYNTYAPLFEIAMPQRLYFGLIIDILRILVKLPTLVRRQKNAIRLISLGMEADSLQSELNEIHASTLIIYEMSRFAIESLDDAIQQHPGDLKMEGFDSKSLMLPPLPRPRKLCNKANRFQMTDAAASSTEPPRPVLDCEDCRQTIPCYRSIRLSADNKRILNSQSLPIASHSTSGRPDLGASLLCLPCLYNRKERAFSTAMAFEEHMREHLFYEIVQNEASDPVVGKATEYLNLVYGLDEADDKDSDEEVELTVSERWQDLERYIVPRSTISYLRSRGITIQRFEYAADGDVICDYHTLEIKKYPCTSDGTELMPTSLLALIRKDINGFLNTEVCRFEPLDPALDATKWNSENPVGCVLRMEVPRLNNTTFGLALVGMGTTNMHFVTVKTQPGGVGENPLSGIREIGIDADNVFFTKGITRFTQHFEVPPTSILELQDRLWRGFMLRVEGWIDTHSGKASKSNFVEEIIDICDSEN